MGTAIISRRIFNSVGGGVPPPEAGFFPTEFNSYGKPTKGTLYGMTSIPIYYFYNYSSSYS
ncbi:MAG: hypothetical protein ACI4PR_01780, partial [Acutalibacteraceae bacterium]